MDVDELHVHEMEADAALLSGRHLMSVQNQAIARVLSSVLSAERLVIKAAVRPVHIPVRELPGEGLPGLVRDPLRPHHFIVIPF